MDELLAVGIALSSQDVHEDEDEDVSHNVSWVLDQLVADEEQHSDVLEAVAGQQETDSSGFDNVAECGFNFFVDLAAAVDGFGFLDESEEFGFGFEVVGVLEIRYILQSSVLESSLQSWVSRSPCPGYRIHPSGRSP